MKYLQIKKQDSIAIVSLNRPESMNALSIDVLKEICTLQEHFRQDLDTRVVIFTGEGENFSAGADLKEKAQLSTKLESWRNNFGKPAIKSILDIDQITIAAVNGYCLGGAACIASACDFRVASKKAILGYPEINLGINLNWLGLPLAVRLIGPAKAKKMVISGENEIEFIPYNDIQLSKKILDKNKKKIMCILIEPIQACLPSENYQKYLRFLYTYSKKIIYCYFLMK